MSAIVNGCDFLELSLPNLPKLVSYIVSVYSSGHGPVDVDYSALDEEIKAITDAINSMTSTCGFMSMMINRCIDYTKAAHNIQLGQYYIL